MEAGTVNQAMFHLLIQKTHSPAPPDQDSPQCLFLDPINHMMPFSKRKRPFTEIDPQGESGTGRNATDHDYIKAVLRGHLMVFARHPVKERDGRSRIYYQQKLSDLGIDSDEIVNTVWIIVSEEIIDSKENIDCEEITISKEIIDAEEIISSEIIFDLVEIIASQEIMETSNGFLDPEVLAHVGRAVFMEIDLDIIANNLRLMKKRCTSNKAGCISVVKANAYGHGAVVVSRFLKENYPDLAERLAVATVSEGVQLRLAGLQGPIHVLGNVQCWEMPECVQYSLTPTVTSPECVAGMAKALSKLTNNKQPDPVTQLPVGSINIKVDTGMSRNGCKMEELPAMIQLSKSLKVPVDGIFTHIAAVDDKEFTAQQVKRYEQCISNYKNDGYKFHMSGSAAILYDVGTSYDYIRPGVAIFGLPVDADLDRFTSLGLKPAMAVKGTPTLVKKCPKGAKIGYGGTYTCAEDEWIGTFPIGYADGYPRSLGKAGPYIVRDKTGEKCPLVGRISMDAITVKLPEKPDRNETFFIVTADLDPKSSIWGLSQILDTIPNETVVLLSQRLPRVYKSRLLSQPTVTRSLEVQTPEGTLSWLKNNTNNGNNGNQQQGEFDFNTTTAQLILKHKKWLTCQWN